MNRKLKFQNHPVLFLTQEEESASTRCRVRAYVPLLEGMGIRCRVERFPDGWPAQAAMVRRMRPGQVLVVQRKRFLAPFLGLVRRRDVRILYDFDDAVFMKRGGARSARREFEFRRTVTDCDVTLAGSRFLVAACRRLVPASRPVFLPTSVDVGAYPRRGGRGSGPFVAGWIGSSGTLGYLEAILPALEEVAGRHDLVLEVVCDRFPEGWDLEVRNRPWRLEEEGADAARFDVGLGPLADDDWCRGKCGLKVVQYLAAGVPAIVSPVGANAEIVEDGVHGLWAANHDEWVAALERTIADEEGRRRMGEAGRQRVEERYSLAANAPRLGRWIRS